MKITFPCTELLLANSIHVSMTNQKNEYTQTKNKKGSGLCLYLFYRYRHSRAE